MKSPDRVQKEAHPYTSTIDASECMEEDAQAVSTIVTGEEDLQVTPSIGDAVDSFLSKYRKNVKKRPKARSVYEALTVGSTYMVQDIKPVRTPYGPRQVWTMEEVVSGEVSSVWAPSELSQHSVDKASGMLKRSVIPILERITFQYKGYTYTSRNTKRYKFALNKAG